MMNMSVLALDSKGHEEFPEAEVQATVKKRRTAVERAEESLAKAKEKARLKMLRLAHGHVEEAMTLVTASGDISFRVYAGQASETVNMRDLLIDIRAAIRQEIGE
jgi:hypothetical protein